MPPIETLLLRWVYKAVRSMLRTQKISHQPPWGLCWLSPPSSSLPSEARTAPDAQETLGLGELPTCAYDELQLPGHRNDPIPPATGLPGP